MVELGEHAHTHIVPRLHKVIDGEDKGGVTKDVSWQGGAVFDTISLLLRCWSKTIGVIG